MRAVRPRLPAKLISAQLRKARVTKSHTLSFVIGDAVTASGVRLTDSQLEDLHSIMSRTWNPATGRFRAVVAADLDSVVGPMGTSRTKCWEVGSEASIALDGRKLHWAVRLNNHSVERAHEHPLGVALFRQLDRITWTRGTGGQIVGNDEYNEDYQDCGRGANYVTRSWSFQTKAQRETAQGARQTSRLWW